MSGSRPSKHQGPNNGGASHDPIPFLDNLHVVHAQEGRLQCVARNTAWTAPTERSPQCIADYTWMTATSWGEPLDDPELALDPNSDWYNEVVAGDVMQPNENILVATLPKRRKKSKVSVGLQISFSVSLF